MTRHILVVCQGNVCRSPIAQYLLQRRHPHAVVSSAGLAALSGEPMHPYAQTLLRQHGLDGSGHLARQLHDGLIEHADLILCMEQAQVARLRVESPHAAGLTFLLDAHGGGHDIPDPWHKPRTAFERAYRMIERAVARWDVLPPSA